MATSKELRAQAAELIKQAEALEQKERNEAREAILALMRESGLTPEEFLSKPSKGMHVAGGGKSNKGTGKSTGPVAAQFRNPDTGESWSGRGRAPRWLAGKDREDYRIQAAA